MDSKWFLKRRGEKKLSFFGGKAGKNGKLREKEKSYVYAYMAF